MTHLFIAVSFGVPTSFSILTDNNPSQAIDLIYLGPIVSMSSGNSELMEKNLQEGKYDKVNYWYHSIFYNMGKLRKWLDCFNKCDLHIYDF